MVDHREDRPASADVFIDLGRNCGVGGIALKYQQTIGATSLAQGLVIADARAYLHDVGEIVCSDFAAQPVVLAAGAEHHLQLAGIEQCFGFHARKGGKEG